MIHAEEDPFAAFKESQPLTTEAPAEKLKNGRKKKAAKKTNGKNRPKATKPAAEVPKRTRKARQPRPVMLPLTALRELGSLSDAESSAVAAIATNLQTLPKKSRGRVTAALSKIFT